MEQVRLCAVLSTENWLDSSMNHMQGWMTVWECCRYALERGCLFVTVLKWKGLRVEWIPWSLQGGRCHCRCRHVTMMECVSGRLIRHPSVAAALANVFAASGSDYKEEELSFIFSILNLLFFSSSPPNSYLNILHFFCIRPKLTDYSAERECFYRKKACRNRVPIQ